MVDWLIVTFKVDRILFLILSQFSIFPNSFKWYEHSTEYEYIGQVSFSFAQRETTRIRSIVDQVFDYNLTDQLITGLLHNLYHHPELSLNLGHLSIFELLFMFTLIFVAGSPFSVSIFIAFMRAKVKEFQYSALNFISVDLSIKSSREYNECDDTESSFHIHKCEMISYQYTPLYYLDRPKQFNFFFLLLSWSVLIRILFFY